MGFFSKLFGGSKKPGGNLPRINVSKRFDLLGRTGQGSMSKVWRARDNKLGRMVCLKVLDKEKTARFEARFLGLKRPLEGAVCAILKHKNIVQTFEYGMTTDGEQYLVMELIDGVGLNFLIETQSAQLLGSRVNYLCQLCDAMQYLHEQKFLHRDLCPRNVMVTKDGVVKLIDFGLTIPYTPEFCRPGNRTGTPDYLAPEIIRRQHTDHRVDLFALGVTAYETFTGGLPWEKAQGSLETLRKRMNTPPKDPREILPKLDEATTKVLLKSLAHDPAGRYQTAADFREALTGLPRQNW